MGHANSFPENKQVIYDMMFGQIYQSLIHVAGTWGAHYNFANHSPMFNHNKQERNVPKDTFWAIRSQRLNRHVYGPFGRNHVQKGLKTSSSCRSVPLPAAEWLRTQFGHHICPATSLGATSRCATANSKSRASSRLTASCVPHCSRGCL